VDFAPCQLCRQCRAQAPCSHCKDQRKSCMCAEKFVKCKRWAIRRLCRPLVLLARPSLRNWMRSFNTAVRLRDHVVTHLYSGGSWSICSYTFNVRHSNFNFFIKKCTHLAQNKHWFAKFRNIWWAMKNQRNKKCYSNFKGLQNHTHWKFEW